MSILSTTDGAASVSERISGQWSRYLEAALMTVLWVYLASLPFRGLLFIERNGFLLLLALLLIWSLSQRRFFYRPTALDVPLLAFVGWIAITLPFSQHPAYSLKEFGKLVQGIIIFHSVMYFLGDRVNRTYLVWFMVAGTCLVSLYGIAQYSPSNQQAIASFLPSEVWLTTYLVMLIPLSLGAAYGETRFWLRGIAFATGISAMVCLVLARSRAGSLALVIELILLAWLFRRWRGFVVAMVAALALIGALWFVSLAKVDVPVTAENAIPVNKNVASIVHRFDIWKFTLNEILQHPIVGIGYGKDNFLLVYGGTAEEVEPGHAAVRKAGVHNIFLYHALHVGIPGAVLFIWLMIRTVKTLLIGVKESRDPSSYGIVAGIVVAVVGALARFQFDLMLVGTLAVLFWTLLAVGMSYLPAREEQSASALS